MLNPIVFTERVVRDFLRYQLTTYPFADAHFHGQLRELLNLRETRRSPLLKGPYVSLSRAFAQGATMEELVADGVLHRLLPGIAPFPAAYGHQVEAMRAIRQRRTTVISTGTGSGKTEAFLYPIISRCLELRDQNAPAGVVAVLVYPMNALAEDQLERLRGLLAGTGISFGMYVGKTPERAVDVQGSRLEAGASRAAYETAVIRRARERERAPRRLSTAAIHPPEERCSREEMRASGHQPRILLTNVQQLELLLTRQRDVELFDGSQLEFVVFDEAHTFKGAQGSETACLVRRLRAFCGRSPEEVTCVAASATMVSADGSATAGREFAQRFFGVSGEQVAVVTERYEDDAWPADREPAAPLLVGPEEALDRLVDSLSATDEGRIRATVQELLGWQLEDDWSTDLNDRLQRSALLRTLVDTLSQPQPLEQLHESVSANEGRTVDPAEILFWLALGSAARKEGRPLVRPVLHAFVRGIGGAVITLPEGEDRPRLWLSVEDEKLIAAEGEEHCALPVKSCVTCGQHYFSHELAGFEFAGDAPGGGEIRGETVFWRPLPKKDGGIRVTLFDRIISDDDEEEGDAPHRRSQPIWLCRHCGTTHAQEAASCMGCGRAGSLVRLQAVQQNPRNPHYLSSCLACGSRGRDLHSGGSYREPARPVRATTVSDVHVLGQNMLLHGREERLLIFADNRQDAAFQAGWMRDHARRFRLRSLILERIAEGLVTIGDLAAWMDERLQQDPHLSESLVPEVWRLYHPEHEPQRHRDEIRYFLRILILREVTTGARQRVGLEPWGLLRVDYRGIDSERAFFGRWAPRLDLTPVDLAHGVAGLLDLERRRTVVHDEYRQIFGRFWNPGDEEVLRGYMPVISGVPRGLKLFRAPTDDQGRVGQWWSTRGVTAARHAAIRWGVPKDDVLTFLEDLWQELKDESRILVEVQLRGGGRGGSRVLAGTQGSCQIDAGRLLLGAQDRYWECGVCRRRHSRPTPHGYCLGRLCSGTVVERGLDDDNYDLAMIRQAVGASLRMLKPREHSAQVPVEERERLERLFKNPGESAVNTLVCTPTLEMGVDIGGLDSVMMRNVPPLAANYWQRAGRAGRRHRMAVNLTYARPAPHDQAVFRDPMRLLRGSVLPPRINLRNPELVRKHAHATVLTVLHRLARTESPLETEAKVELSETLAACFPQQVRTFLFDGAGNVLPQATDVSILARVLVRHRDAILQALRASLRDSWPEVDQAFVTEEILVAIVDDMPRRLVEVVDRLWRRLQWARREKDRFGEIERLRGTLDHEDRAMYQRCDRLIRRLKGEELRQRGQTEGVDDTNTYAVLAMEGFLPGYGLDRGSVLGTAVMPRGIPGPAEYRLPRPSGMALREYVPGNMIYANGQRFVPRYYRLEATDPVVVKLDLAREAIALAESGDTAGGGTTLPVIPICDVDLPHELHIHDEEDHRFQMGVVILGHELGRHAGGQAYSWGATPLQFRRGTHFRLVNIGVSQLVRKDVPSLGYPLCLVSGVSRSPLASQAEIENFRTNLEARHGREPERVGFYADVVADSICIQDLGNLGTAFSLMEGLRLAAAQVLEMEVEDLQVLCLPRLEEETVDGILYDPMPGGSGLLEQMIECWPQVLEAAAELLNCRSECQTACLDCMLHFRNAHFHRHLDRHKALGFISERTALAPAQAIPAVQPVTRLTTDAQPAHPPEFRLRSMLVRAGLGEPEAQKSIALGNPWGRTIPDFFYPGVDDRTEGVCIYLDGLSRGIHGSAEAQERDLQIREQLRNLGYEVVSIPASSLTERDRMTGFLSRIARYLVPRPLQDRIRKDAEWFE